MIKCMKISRENEVVEKSFQIHALRLFFAAVAITYTFLSGCNFNGTDKVSESGKTIKGEKMDNISSDKNNKGKKYKIRSPEEIALNGNHLKGEKSVYLKQHAYNPIDWYPWGDEALDRAKNENKPVFLSIGYSSCHWCHVMEHEVFEKNDVAEYMNEHFVSIKVDREERPDLDSIFMDAVQAITGGGGWPMSVFLTQDLVPFYGGTYFPKNNFMALTAKIIHEFENNKESLLTQADKLKHILSSSYQVNNAESEIDFDYIGKVVDRSVGMFDYKWGGFKSSMKFPTPSRWKFLLNYYRKTGDEIVRRGLRSTLNQMASGGINDHLSGGFHRYTTEETWLVPHFEKMLYDNAQLASLYIDAYSVFGDEKYGEVAKNTLDFMIKDMSGDEGGFYSSFDADSGGEEGSYYVWSKKEIVDIAGEKDGYILADLLGVTDAGNFEGQNILTKRVKAQELADKYNVSKQRVEALLHLHKDNLLEYRNKRVKPGLDKKIVTSWNGLAIQAFAKGYQVFDDIRYKEAAEKSADYLWKVHKRKDGGLYRVSNEQHAEHAAILDDYAFLALGLLELFNATQKFEYLKNSLDLYDYVEKYFAREGGGFYLAEHSDELPFARKVDLYDSVRPSGYSAMLEVLLRLMSLTGDKEFKQTLENGLLAFASNAQKASIDMAGWYNAAMLLQGPFYDVIIAGTEEDRGDILSTEFYKINPPNSVLVVLDEDKENSKMLSMLPVTEGKVALNTKATAFVCKFGVCKKPTSDPVELKKQLLDGWKL